MYCTASTTAPTAGLHAFYTWREQNNAVMCDAGGLTNHDTGYVYSTDRGRTWRNAAGTVRRHHRRRRQGVRERHRHWSSTR